MSHQSYLIDTNILIGLEDNLAVQPVYSKLLNLAAKHGVSIFVHEAARDDIARDKNEERRKISLSKIGKERITVVIRAIRTKRWPRGYEISNTSNRGWLIT